MKDHKTFRQQLKDQLNKFKRKLRSNPQTRAPASPEIPSTQNESLDDLAIASDQLYEHVHPNDFKSLNEMQNFSLRNRNLRLFGRRLERSASYDSLCFSASTTSELTSIADQSLDMTILHPTRSWNRSSKTLIEYPQNSASLPRGDFRMKSIHMKSSPTSVKNESNYATANQALAEMEFSPRGWISDYLHFLPSLNDNYSGTPHRTVKRQLSFSESDATPQRLDGFESRVDVGKRPFGPSDGKSNTACVSATDTIGPEMVRRMLGRFDSHSPISTDSSIEISRSSARRPATHDFVTNSPSTSWSTNSHLVYHNYHNSPVDMYAASPTTSSLSSILPPPLNTPNSSPDGNHSDVDCILAPPEAFRDPLNITSSTKSVKSES